MAMQKKAADNIKEEAKKRGVKTFQTLRGFKDYLPSEQAFWEEVFNETRALARQYSYSYIDTPILEHIGLFKRSIGEHTDIVEKQMFVFKDAGGDNVALRPEGTASIARAYIQHGMFTEPQPVRLWYWGPMFRYERPQTGRYREFYHAGFESLGDSHPVIDAQHVLIAYTLFQHFGVTPLIQINSIGHKECRHEYIKKLSAHYRKNQKVLCQDCKKRLVKNTLRVLDCKEDSCQPVKREAPQIVDNLCDECRDHFVKVLEYLDESEVPYQLNPHLVRGLDYYTRTVYEFYPSSEGSEGKSQSSMGGGGRYDTLIEEMGGRPTPAAGFALGLERVLLAIRDAGYTPEDFDKPDIFVAQLGDQARRQAMKLFEELRKRNIRVAELFSKDGLKGQLEQAARKKARYTLIIGQKEVLDGTIIIRDMESGIQEIADRKKVAVEIIKKLKGENGEEQK